MSDTDHSEMQRRLATILAADVAGYSRMMGENEEATVATLRGHRAVFDALLKQHRGRVFNTAGDAILAEFPSAVDAVRCATEIQAALQTRNAQLPPERKMLFRMGINLGDVVVQGTDLLGDGVNVAARIQTVAEPGGICISGSVYDQILNKLTLEFQTLGDQTFKNIARPVRTFTITHGEAGAIPTAIPRTERSPISPAMMVAFGVFVTALAGYALYHVIATKPTEQTTQAAAGKQTAESAADSDHAAAPAENHAAEEQAAPQKEPEVTAAPAVAPTANAPGGGTKYDGTYDGTMCNFPFNPDKKKCWPVSLKIRNGMGTGSWSAERASGQLLYAHVTLGPQGIVTVVLDGTTAKGKSRNGALSGRLANDAIAVNGQWANGIHVDGHWTRAK